MNVDANVYFICLTIRMYTFMQWELKVWNEDNVLSSLSLSLAVEWKKIKFFLVFYLNKFDHNT